jgi:hypothetical protein
MARGMLKGAPCSTRQRGQVVFPALAIVPQALQNVSQDLERHREDWVVLPQDPGMHRHDLKMLSQDLVMHHQDRKMHSQGLGMDHQALRIDSFSPPIHPFAGVIAISVTEIIFL